MEIHQFVVAAELTVVPTSLRCSQASQRSLRKACVDVGGGPAKAVLKDPPQRAHTTVVLLCLYGT